MSRRRTDWGQATPLDIEPDEVAIVGVGEGDHSKASGRTFTQISAQAIERALEDAGLAPDEVDGLCYSGGMGARFGAEDFHAHFGTKQEIFESVLGSFVLLTLLEYPNPVQCVFVNVALVL